MKDEYSFKNAKRGAIVPPPPGTVTLTRIAIDEDVINWFRGQVTDATKGDFRHLINAALREHIARERAMQEEETNPQETPEEMFRRVLREELRPVSKMGEK